MSHAAPAWTRLDDIRRTLETRWRKGDLLRAWLQPDAAFPLRLPLKAPTSRQLNEHFEHARQWVRQWQADEAKGDFCLEWQPINHRQLGRNTLPRAIRFAHPEQALALIDKRQAARRFGELYGELTSRFPGLETWCLQKPLTLLDKAADWPRLLAVIAWLQAYPRPGIYLRQLEIPGVHTKFIERHRGLLGELLDRVLPAEAIEPEATGASQFERRYGFLTKPAQVRLRLLDPTQSLSSPQAVGLADLQLPVSDFNTLTPMARTVVIVENEITALAIPPRASTLVIFGQGYGVDRLLEGAEWLLEKSIYYWGDLDSHGFAILDRLRGVLPHTRSLLMDMATLLDNRPLWGREPSQTRRRLAWLSDHEQAVYQALTEQRLGENIRLEQERIRLSALQAALPRD